MVIFASKIEASTMASKVSTFKYYTIAFQQLSVFTVVALIMMLSDVIDIFVKMHLCITIKLYYDPFIHAK